MRGVSRLSGPVLLAVAVVTCACGDEAARRGATVMFASGADLQSINPLLTTHPLARQVQRYVLLTTLARYDSLLVPQPYLARSWRWSADGRTLTFRLRTDVRWHDGIATTARDVAGPGHRLSSLHGAADAGVSRRVGRLDRRAAILGSGARTRRGRSAVRPHRSRDSAGAPARQRAARPPAPGFVERQPGG